MGYVLSMLPEIHEAIERAYEKSNDTQGIGADCYVYLAKSSDPIISGYFTKVLEDEGLCPRCGEKLSTKEYKEYHSEVMGYETMQEVYCKNCDFEP